MAEGVEMIESILRWVLTGEVGSSSKAMAAAIARIKIEDNFHPLDPHDFRECIMFLRAVPEARKYMGRVAELSDVWSAMVDQWGGIESLFFNEAGIDYEKGRYAPHTYELIQEIIRSVQDIVPNETIKQERDVTSR